MIPCRFNDILTSILVWKNLIYNGYLCPLDYGSLGRKIFEWKPKHTLRVDAHGRKEATLILYRSIIDGAYQYTCLLSPANPITLFATRCDLRFYLQLLKIIACCELWDANFWVHFLANFTANIDFSCKSWRIVNSLLRSSYTNFVTIKRMHASWDGPNLTRFASECHSANSFARLRACESFDIVSRKSLRVAKSVFGH